MGVPDVIKKLDKRIIPEFRTDLGRAYCMDSLALMKRIPKESVDLIVTSPPYALIKKKEYGNEDDDRYVKWFMGFANDFWRILKPTGSLVLNIGGAYQKGNPVRSLCHFEVMLKLCTRKTRSFHLAQEFYWYNPAKMPAPAEWVTVRRVRVRDSVEPVWWLSKGLNPKANNRNILVEYGDSMKELLRKGYNAGLRPSGHNVSEKWGTDNGGAIPPNVLEMPELNPETEEAWESLGLSNMIRLANTSSSDRYRKRCKEVGIKPHPATFPIGLPQYFIKFLTDEGDIVFDPFGGSGTTGAAAEAEGRYWITSDLNREYVRAARFRFPEIDSQPKLGTEEVDPTQPDLDQRQSTLFSIASESGTRLED